MDRNRDEKQDGGPFMDSQKKMPQGDKNTTFPAMAPRKDELIYESGGQQDCQQYKRNHIHRPALGLFPVWHWSSSYKIKPSHHP